MRRGGCQTWLWKAALVPVHSPREESGCWKGVGGGGLTRGGGTARIPCMWPCCEELLASGAVGDRVRGHWPWETSQTCRGSSHGPVP